MAANPKRELHDLVDRLAADDLAEVLDFARWLASAGEALTADELAAMRHGEAEIAAGEFTTLAELRRAAGR